MHDVIVIGGGVSGMSFAHGCAEAGLTALVLEKDAAAGGCIQSWRQTDGFWSELGAHTCYNSYTALLGILERRGALAKLRPRAKVPFRLLVGDDVRPIKSELRLLELVTCAPRLLWTRKAGRTVRGYYRRIVGGLNYDRVFGPLFTAVPSQPADDFPADMMFKRRTRRKDVPRSYTLDGGLSSAIEAMARTPALTLTTRAEAVALRREGARYVVRLASGAQEVARFVAVAAPPPVGAALLRDVNPRAAAALDRIRITAIDTLGVVVGAGDTPLAPFAGIIPLDGRFYSVVSRDTVPDERRRGFAFHARPGASMDERLRQAGALLGVDPGRFAQVTRREVVLPAPRLGHDAIVRDVDAALAGSPLFITGNYFGGLAIEDCVLRSLAEVRRLRATA